MHYDLRLELDGLFKSRAVTRGPSLDPHDKRLAVEVEDHPLDYGDFGGTIPKGEYGEAPSCSGTVATGSRKAADLRMKLPRNDFRFKLGGERLQGSFVLLRMRHDREAGKRTNWLLIKHHDAFSVEGNGSAILEENTSVASGRTMEAIASGKGKNPKPFMLQGDAAGADAVWESSRGLAGEKREAGARSGGKKGKTYTATTPGKSVMPEFIAPQLCETLTRPPAGQGWIHEIKSTDSGSRCGWRMAKSR